MSIVSIWLESDAALCCVVVQNRIRLMKTESGQLVYQAVDPLLTEKMKNLGSVFPFHGERCRHSVYYDCIISFFVAFRCQ
jgi:hypothetical protein